jgi:hypothetical protein
MRRPTECDCGCTCQEEGMPFLLISTSVTGSLVSFKWECPDCGNIITIINKIEE